MKGLESCEIIIVDDGSTDGTQAVAYAHKIKNFKKIKCVRQQNLGPGLARNKALEMAKFDRVVFLDDDVHPRDDLLIQHQKFMDKGYTMSQGWLHWHPSLEKKRIIQFMEKRGMQFVGNAGNNSRQISCLNIYTANLAARKKDILECGGFDGDLSEKRYAFEDTALAFRLEQKGACFGLNQNAVAVHYHPQTRKSLVEREYKVGFSAGVLEEKYNPIFRRLNFHRTTRLASLQAQVFGKLTHIMGLERAAGYDLSLRIQLRNAFIRGYLASREVKTQFL